MFKHRGIVILSYPLNSLMDVVIGSERSSLLKRLNNLDSTSTQAIPPSVQHQVKPLGPVQFSIDFLIGSERGAVLV